MEGRQAESPKEGDAVRVEGDDGQKQKSKVGLCLLLHGLTETGHGLNWS